MQRRTFLQTAAATLLVPPPNLARRAASDWTALGRQIGDRLIDIRSPLIECARNHGAGADALFADLKNPFYLSDEPALTQTLGWTDAWTSEPSLKGVAATSARDVAAAIDFCRNSGIPPVIKGGGHSYFGNSNRAGSLLVWTHRMRHIELHDAFRPEGAPGGASPLPAVSVGAGCLWGEVYRNVAVENGRYVQGGGCLTVGVAGLVQGGGFGSLSKQFGTGAANLIEAEVVTADGRIRTVNRWRHPDLFFALRGGGGGTFGVVTRLTLRTHPLPALAGAVHLVIRATSEAAWQQLAEHMVDFYADHLFNPTWGEQIRFGRSRLTIDMICHDLSKEQIAATWAPFIDWARQRPKDFEFVGDPSFIALPARSLWDPAVLRQVPGAVLEDGRPGASPNNIYWTGNRGEAAQVLHAYQSAWLPNRLLERPHRHALALVMAAAGQQWDITWHCNKGLGGGSPEAIRATLETATNPEVVDSFALVICAAEEQPAYPGIPGHEPKVEEGRREAAGVTRAMAEIYKLAPNAGAYVSESNYFQRDFKRAYWGSNYSRLAAIKRRYDPSWLFRGRNCVEPV